MKLKCRKCKYEWDWKGKHKYYATCPRCLSKINVEKIFGAKEAKQNDKTN